MRPKFAFIPNEKTLLKFLSLIAYWHVALTFVHCSIWLGWLTKVRVKAIRKHIPALLSFSHNSHKGIHYKVVVGVLHIEKPLIGLVTCERSYCTVHKPQEWHAYVYTSELKCYYSMHASGRLYELQARSLVIPLSLAQEVYSLKIKSQCIDVNTYVSCGDLHSFYIMWNSLRTIHNFAMQLFKYPSQRIGILSS